MNLYGKLSNTWKRKLRKKNLVFSKFWRTTVSFVSQISVFWKKSLFKVILYQISSKAMKFQQQIAGGSFKRYNKKYIEKRHIWPQPPHQTLESIAKSSVLALKNYPIQFLKKCFTCSVLMDGFHLKVCVDVREPLPYL